MSANLDWTKLCSLLEREATSLSELHRAMCARRAAFIALLPSQIESAVAELEAAGQKAANLENERAALATTFGVTLGLGETPRLSDLARRAPQFVRSRLSRARADLDRAARSIQVESRVGERLLEFSRQAQEGFVQELFGAVQETNDGGNGYDRSARCVGTGPRTGTLISGTV